MNDELRGGGKVVTFGEVMGRLCPPEFLRFEQVAPGPWNMTFGGAESSVAASVKRFGGESEFVTALPSNAIAESCVRQLRSFGVGTDHIRRVPNSRLGLYFVERGANQRPSQVIYDRAHSAFSQVSADDFDWSEVFDGASWFHTTGITLAVSGGAAEAACRAAEAARAAGVTVSVDLNFRATLWKWRSGYAAEKLAQEIMPNLVRLAHVVIGNEEDAEKTLGIRAEGSDTHAGHLEISGFASVAREIMSRFPNVDKVATTLRESVSATHNNWGAILSVRGQEPVLAPLRNGTYTPYEIRAIVDRVGGGDAFAGSLIYALNSGTYPTAQEALNFAAAASCLAHSISGDYNLISRAEAEALMKGNGSGRVVR